jgi:hypothetical protein
LAWGQDSLLAITTAERLASKPDACSAHGGGWSVPDFQGLVVSHHVEV